LNIFIITTARKGALKYKDWLDYKKYYKKLGYPMNETFIEWIEREVELEGVKI
jgi:hypothetical protein